MNDIDRLGTRLDELLAAVHLLSGRLSTQSQDMAALRKRIEALETEAQGVGSSHCVDCGKAWSVVQVCCDQGVSGEGRHVLGRCVTCCPCRFKTKAPASPAPPAPLVERIEHVIATTSRVDECARAALLVAAEELLGPITGEEMDVFDSAEESSRQGIDRVLRRRLARAKEAGL